MHIDSAVPLPGTSSRLGTLAHLHQNLDLVYVGPPHSSDNHVSKAQQQHRGPKSMTGSEVKQVIGE